MTNFGVFVQLEPELEGLLHVSELADEKIEKPEDVVKVGETIEVRVLRVDEDERKIGLSRKLEADENEEVPAGEESSSEATERKRPEELKGGTGGSAGPLFSMGAAEPEATEGGEESSEEASE
ncbi:MAG: S1 RNA-binding domain-containing protein [Planctomycetaceae bacterium]